MAEGDSDDRDGRTDESDRYTDEEAVVRHNKTGNCPKGRQTILSNFPIT